MPYRKYLGFIPRNYGSLYGYLVGMMIEGAATVVLMAVGLLISFLGFYLWK